MANLGTVGMIKVMDGKVWSGGRAEDGSSFAVEGRESSTYLHMVVWLNTFP